MSAVRRLLGRAQPGSPRTVQAHIRRGEAIQAAIAGRWPQIERPQQWRAKHVRWFLEHGLASATPATRYDYYRSIRSIGRALGRWTGWAPHLRGPWESPEGRRVRGAGGRPPAVPGRG